MITIYSHNAHLLQYDNMVCNLNTMLRVYYAMSWDLYAKLSEIEMKAYWYGKLCNSTCMYAT